MYCAYKKGGYAFGNMYPKEAFEIFDIAEKGGVKQISGLIPTESQLAQGISISMSFWIMYVLLKTIRDQNQYNAKKKDDNNSPHKSKDFSDVRGCKKAKEALMEMISYM